MLVFTFGRCRTMPLSLAWSSLLLKPATENRLEEITEVATAEPATTLKSVAGTCSCMKFMTMLPVRTESIIGLTFFRVLEYFVGLVYLLEFIFGGRILVDIRMKLSCQFTVRLLDVCFGRIT